MFRRSHKSNDQEILDIVNSRGNNNRCGECSQEYPTWALWNLGILLCGRCADCHKQVLLVPGPRGQKVLCVKSLTLETWAPEQLENLRRIGNRRAKNRWNPKLVPFPDDADEDTYAVEAFLKDKYLRGRFRDDNIDPADYGDKSLRYLDDLGTASPAARSRLGLALRSRASLRARGPLPLLTHRKCTAAELAQFGSQASKIVGFGYTDRDAVVESLVLADGSIDTALDILDIDSKTNPASAEVPPSLPKRPPPSQQPSQSSAPTSAGSNWWAGLAHQTGLTQTGLVFAGGQPQTAPQATAQAAAQPQIYQYTDPLTGQVLYVDANGQQYLDPNNPQHQQMLYQQSPQYLTQQATKQNIMSLYGQPDSYSTNVAQPIQGQVNQMNQGQVNQMNPMGQGQMSQAQYNQAQFTQGQMNQAQYNQAQFNQAQFSQGQINQGQMGQMGQNQMTGQVPMTQQQFTGAYGQYPQFR